jgi:glutaminyl-tRNA synthetase
VDSIVDVTLLENSLREELNRKAPRAMAILRPLKVVLVNYPEGQIEEMELVNNPEDPGQGTRKVQFSRVLFIERDDFMEEPVKKFYRLAPGREVRLRSAYFIKCVDVLKDDKTGEIRELHCTYDPATRGGDAPDGRTSKATLHWVSASSALDAEIRIYDHLFTVRDPGDVPEGVDYKTLLNPKSLEVLTSCKVEPSLKASAPGSRYQFERMGYFCVDSRDSSPQKPVFNRIVTLRDPWAKISKSLKGK